MITATRKASDYTYRKNALRPAVEAMGCDVISNTTSLDRAQSAGQACRQREGNSSRDAQRTASVSGRPDAITEITSRFD